MLSSWWKKRDAERAPVVLVFRPVDLECDCEHGTYYVERTAPDYEAKFRPADACPDARRVGIDARDEEGNSMDWPSRGCAEEACRLHAHLMELGHGALRAAELVAQRSQQLIREWRARRPVVLAYTETAAAR